MRRYVWIVPSLFFVAAAALLPSASGQAAREEAAEPPAAKAKAAPAAANPALAARKMERLLVLWEKQSTLLKNLDVKIERIDEEPAWGTTRFEGRAIFQSPNLAWLDFQKVNAKKELVPYERIVCTGKEVWQYKSDVKKIFVYKLGNEDQKRALQEGPLPFLFNFRVNEAQRRYDMMFVKEVQQGEKVFYYIKVFPRLKIDREAFNVALLKLDGKYLLPTQISMIMPDEKSRRHFVLTQIKPNLLKLDGQLFVGRPIKGWEIERDPGNKPAVQAVGPVGRAPRGLLNRQPR